MRPSARYLDEARELVLRALEGFPADVYLYGSWARGDARRTSDIDVAVLPKSPIPPSVLAKLRESLEESHIPYPVEVVDLASASSSLRERVLKEGVRWSA